MNNVNDILGSGGLIARKLHGYEERPEQLAMARAVEEAFNTRRHLIVEAGTGVGKSFAYLAPAIQRALAARNDERPVVISTGTIALQEQLIAKDIPFLRSVWDEEFTSVLAKGRGNYISLRRLDVALKQEQGTMMAGDELRELTRIKAWSEETADGSRATLDFEPSGEVWSQVVSERTNCMGRQCPNYESRCFYQRAKRRMYNAHLLVVNHALLCADLALKAQGVNYLPDYQHLIIDEAHDLEHYASENLGIRQTRLGVNFMLSQLYNARKNKGLLTRFDFLRGAFDRFRAARDATEAYFTEAESWAYSQKERPARVLRPEPFGNRASDALRELSISLKEGMLLTQSEEERVEIESHAIRVRESAEALDAFNMQALENQVYWVEVGLGARRDNIELRAAPVEVGPLLEKLIFNRCQSVILTSATLATGPDNFDYMRARLGFARGERSMQLHVGSPFNFREHAQIVVPDLPEPPKGRAADEDYERRVCEEVIEAVRRSRGGVFVLFTSYSQMRRVRDATAPKLQLLGHTLLTQGEGMTSRRMLEQFKAGQKMVLMGVETFWQGVDVPGEALTTVVLVRLPFPVPGEPLVAARMEAIQNRGGNDFNEYMVPEATIKLRQGFGRLIRRKDDFGTVVILDSRIVRKPYGKRMLKALPDCPLTDGKGGNPLAKKKPASDPLNL